MTDNLKDLKSIMKGAVFVVLSLVISKILGFTYRIIIARYDTEGYGLFILGLTIYSFTLTVSLAGIPSGIVKYVSQYLSKNDVKQMREVAIGSLKLIFLISLILSTIIFLFTPLLAKYLFHEEGLIPFLRIMIIALPINALYLAIFSITKAFQKSSYEVILKNIIETTLKLVFTAAFLIAGISLGIPFAFSLATIIVGSIALYYLNKNLIKLRSEEKTKLLNKEVIFFSLPLLFSGLTDYAVISLDNLVLGVLKNSYDIGIYNAAVPLAQLLYLIPYGISYLFFPILTQLYYSNKKEEFKEIYLISTKWVFLINVYLLAIFVLFSKEWLWLFFGEEYTIASSALVILLIGYLFGYLATNAQSLILIRGKSKFLFYASAATAVLNLVLNLILIPKMGINGAAIASSISFLVLGALTSIIAYSLTKINYFTRRYIYSTIAITVPAVIFLIAKTRYGLDINFLTIPLSMILIFLIYVCLLYITGCFEKQDVAMLRSVKNKIFPKQV